MWVDACESTNVCRVGVSPHEAAWVSRRTGACLAWLLNCHMRPHCFLFYHHITAFFCQEHMKGYSMGGCGCVHTVTTQHSGSMPGVGLLLTTIRPPDCEPAWSIPWGHICGLCCGCSQTVPQTVLHVFCVLVGGAYCREYYIRCLEATCYAWKVRACGMLLCGVWLCPGSTDD